MTEGTEMEFQPRVEIQGWEIQDLVSDKSINTCFGNKRRVNSVIGKLKLSGTSQNTLRITLR